MFSAELRSLKLIAGAALVEAGTVVVVVETEAAAAVELPVEAMVVSSRRGQVERQERHVKADRDMYIE